MKYYLRVTRNIRVGGDFYGPYDKLQHWFRSYENAMRYLVSLGLPAGSLAIDREVVQVRKPQLPKAPKHPFSN